MKIAVLLLAQLLLLLHYGSPQQQCPRGRPEKIFWSSQRSEIECKTPQKSLVQLEVPEGFDYVKPSVVRIKQCSGLFCPNYPMKCLPVSEAIETKTRTVQAFRTGADHEPTCVKVSVEEHHACECRCDRIYCPDNQIFDDDTCKCQCDPFHKYEDQCNDWRSGGKEVQWSKNACRCQCSAPPECGGTMEWNQGLCQCTPNLYNQNSLL